MEVRRRMEKKESWRWGWRGERMWGVVRLQHRIRDFSRMYSLEGGGWCFKYREQSDSTSYWDWPCKTAVLKSLYSSLCRCVSRDSFAK